jgi:hypothetical protein
METTPNDIASQLFRRNRNATVLEITQWAVGHSGFTESDIVREVIEQYRIIQQRFESREKPRDIPS